MNQDTQAPVKEPQPELVVPLTQATVEPYIAGVEYYGERTADPAASVVIVAYNTNFDLLRCLDSLQAQSCREFETIVVDNGRNEQVREHLRKYPITYVAMRRNYRPCLARNAGIVHARGEVVCFLDDDALAHENFVATHLAAQRVAGILGAQGKVLAKTRNVFNLLAIHYDYGPAPLPCWVDLECNASFKRQALLEVGGWNPLIFYGEGVELSYRLVQRFGDHNSLIYWPDAVIYHDYGSTLQAFVRKMVRMAESQVAARRRQPELVAFAESYQPLPYQWVPRPADLSMRLQYGVMSRLLPVLRRAALAYYESRR